MLELNLNTHTPLLRKFKKTLQSKDKNVLVEMIMMEVCTDIGVEIAEENLKAIENSLADLKNKIRREEVRKQENLLFQEYRKAVTEHDEYIFGLAKKYGFLKYDAEGKPTFKYGDFFDNVSVDELKKATELEKIRNEKQSQYLKIIEKL